MLRVSAPTLNTQLSTLNIVHWGVQDSNLRRQSHQIYSLTRLTASVTPRATDGSLVRTATLDDPVSNDRRGIMLRHSADGNGDDSARLALRPNKFETRHTVYGLRASGGT